MNFSLSALKELLLGWGFDKKTIQKANSKIYDYNLKNMQLFTIFAIFAFATMVVLTVPISFLRRYYYVYMFGLLSSIICSMLTFLTPSNKNFLYAGMSLFVFTVLTFGILVGTLYSDSKEAASTYIALIFATPILFCIKPLTVFLSLLFSNVFFVSFCVIYKEAGVRNNDILNAIAFSVISLIVASMVSRNKIKQFLLEIDLDYAHKMDQMTGLQNRNSYEDKILELTNSQSDEIVSCIFVDVNGLHDLNNTVGHEAGDKMLVFIAKLFMEYFGNSHTYRIGGDEYVAFDFIKNEVELLDLASKFKADVENAGYHVAVGICCEKLNDAEIISIIKNAEVKMYEDKEAHYKKLGKEHR